MTNTAKLSPLTPDDVGIEELRLDNERVTPTRPGARSIVASLFRQHARRIQLFMGFRLRNPEDGQEAAQEVFLKVWRRETEGVLKEDATSYLFAATRTAIIDTERARSSRGHDRHDPGADMELVPAVEPEQEEALHWRRAMEHFVHVIEDLPEISRKAFLLHYFEDMNYDRIAAELGVSRRTVERHIARAMTHCRVRMRNFL